MDAKAGRLIIQAKRIPFHNDPELRRDVNRLSSCGSQLAGWISSAEPVRITSLERSVLASLQK